MKTIIDRDAKPESTFLARAAPTDCSEAIGFINDHFEQDMQTGRLFPGMDPAKAIVLLLSELLELRKANGGEAIIAYTLNRGAWAPVYGSPGVPVLSPARCEACGHRHSPAPIPCPGHSARIRRQQ